MYVLYWNVVLSHTVVGQQTSPQHTTPGSDILQVLIELNILIYNLCLDYKPQPRMCSIQSCKSFLKAYSVYLQYHDVLPLILVCSSVRWAGFGEIPSSAAGEVQMKMASRRNRSRVQSTEAHRGKILSCSNDYFHGFYIDNVSPHTIVFLYTSFLGFLLVVGYFPDSH
jgi:hypothetical protein